MDLLESFVSDFAPNDVIVGKGLLMLHISGGFIHNNKLTNIILLKVCTVDKQLVLDTLIPEQCQLVMSLGLPLFLYKQLSTRYTQH